MSQRAESKEHKMSAGPTYENFDDDKKGEPRHISHELVWMDDEHDAGFPARPVWTTPDVHFHIGFGPIPLTREPARHARYDLDDVSDIPIPVLTRQYRTRIWNEPGSRNHGRPFIMRRVE